MRVPRSPAAFLPPATPRPSATRPPPPPITAPLRGDPRNPELLTRAFLAVTSNGDMEEAVRLAERVSQGDKSDRLSRLVLAVRAIKQKQYQNARQQLAQPGRGQQIDLAAALVAAWTQATPNDSKAAIEAVDKLTGPDWYGVFRELHAGFITDLVGPKKDAAKRFERAYKIAATELRWCRPRPIISPARATRRSASSPRAFDELLPRHPLITEIDVNAGRRGVSWSTAAGRRRRGAEPAGASGAAAPRTSASPSAARVLLAPRT